MTASIPDWPVHNIRILTRLTELLRRENKENDSSVR